MYLHIGNDFVLNEKDVIGIFDFDHISTSHVTMEYLKELEQDSRLISVSDELPKSFVLSVREGMEIGYLSPLSSRTIQHRNTILR